MINKIRGYIIKIIGKKKKRDFDIQKINKVLVPGGRIGDVVCMTPFLRELHNFLPNVEIDVYLDKITAPILENCPYTNVVITERSSRFIHRVKIFRLLCGLYDSFLKRNKYDLIFDFTNNLRIYNILNFKIMNPKYLIGCYRREKFGIKKDELTIFDKYVFEFRSSHMSDICLGFVEKLKNERISNRKYEIYLGEKEEKYKLYFHRNNINIIFNYIGGTSNKNLSFEELKDSCLKLINLNSKIKVHIMTLPQKYKDLENKLLELNEERVVICPKTENILDAAALIKYCDILISVDTGVVHIASSFNIPLISIFLNNDNSIKYFSPKSDISYVIKCEDKKYIKDFDKNKMTSYVNEIINRLNI